MTLSLLGEVRISFLACDPFSDILQGLLAASLLRAYRKTQDFVSFSWRLGEGVLTCTWALDISIDASLLVV
jgi:hypothetical protein